MPEDTAEVLCVAYDCQVGRRVKVDEGVGCSPIVSSLVFFFFFLTAQIQNKLA